MLIFPAEEGSLTTDPYFINAQDGEGSPLYRIYHDQVTAESYDAGRSIVFVLNDYRELLKYADTQPYAASNMLDQMRQLIEMFAARSFDRSTLDELHRMIADDNSWFKAHDLFQRIREKTLAAERRGDELADCQYLFEEVCAKTLYNLSGDPAPFDADSPYWIVPNALSLARCMSIDESEVTKIVAT
jgi:hypothetical protein